MLNLFSMAKQTHTKMPFFPCFPVMGHVFLIRASAGSWNSLAKTKNLDKTSWPLNAF
jgi:hypothetical protein